MLPGYADVYVRSAITAGCQRRGMNVMRAQDRGRCGQDDEVLLTEATAEGRLMLTNDRDFLVLDAAWQAVGRVHAGIIYWPQQKYSNGEAIRRIVDYAGQTSATDAANKVKYL